MRNFLRRIRSDRGDSELVSLVILLPLLFGLIVTTIDSAVYFSNRSQIQAIARDGARTVAIMGGDGTYSKVSQIEKTYGKVEDCKDLMAVPMVSAAYVPNKTSNAECHVLRALAEGNGLVNVTIQSVTCNPYVTPTISTRTSCAIGWSYGSIPGSAFVLIKSDPDPDQGIAGGTPGTTGDQLTIGTSESEVALDDGDLVSRW